MPMYAKGMTASNIENHMKELYDIDISDSTISRITDTIMPVVKEWQGRPLEMIYAAVFMDAIHYHVRSERRIVKKSSLHLSWRRHAGAQGCAWNVHWEK